MLYLIFFVRETLIELNQPFGIFCESAINCTILFEILHFRLHLSIFLFYNRTLSTDAVGHKLNNQSIKRQGTYKSENRNYNNCLNHAETRSKITAKYSFTKINFFRAELKSYSEPTVAETTVEADVFFVSFLGATAPCGLLLKPEFCSSPTIALKN